MIPQNIKVWQNPRIGMKYYALHILNPPDKYKKAISMNHLLVGPLDHVQNFSPPNTCKTNRNVGPQRQTEKHH